MRLAKFCNDGDRCKPEPPTDKTGKKVTVIGGAAIGGKSDGRDFEAVRMEGLLGGNWIGSGERIFYSLIQRVFATFALGLIADLRFELLRVLLRVVLRHFHPTFNNSVAVYTLPRRPHGSVFWRRRVSIVAPQYFTAFCTFSSELTSIWRTRSRETPNSAAKSASVIGSSASLRASKMRRSRSLSTESAEASTLRR